MPLTQATLERIKSSSPGNKFTAKTFLIKEGKK
jgi:hypothetical protein